jgi:hypothetical protein
MYIILEGSDEGERYPFVFVTTREELEKELNQQISEEGLSHRYLKNIPDEGIEVGMRVVIRGEVVIPKAVEIVKKIEIP